ncbi:MAG: hypothetical protein QXF35_00210 [Candidatus Bilamarchaeaceae archaeon]
MKIHEELWLAPYMTFQPNKEKPIHRWFYYKEGYSPEIVEYCLKKEQSHSREIKSLIDPFCGVGTSLLAAKKSGLKSCGIDASELAVLVSKVKCTNYTKEDISEIIFFLSKKLKREASIKWDFELFSPRAAFPKRNLIEILSIREAIYEYECGQKAKDFLLLALLSILPQASIVIKDGGVLKIDKRKRAMPAKEAFFRKLKLMLKDIEENKIDGPEPAVFLGDARHLNFKDEYFDVAITSPPYLNNVDYSKIYGLELSLLALDQQSTKKTRGRLLHSFIKGDHFTLNSPPECGDVGQKIPIVGSYFADMELVIKELQRVLGEGRAAYFVVSNAVIFNEHILVDKILAEIGNRLGMEAEIIIGAYRFADVKPQRVQTRESVVILRK